MSSAIAMLLAGAPIDKTGESYRIYQAGQLLSARIKAAIWLLRDHPDRLIRTHLRDARKHLGRRSELRAQAIGPHCSRMQPTISQETLNGLRDRDPDVQAQAHALVRSRIPDLDAADRLVQEDACLMILSHDAGDVLR